LIKLGCDLADLRLAIFVLLEAGCHPERPVWCEEYAFIAQKVVKEASVILRVQHQTF
jgi:hypothetical protein